MTIMRSELHVQRDPSSCHLFSSTPPAPGAPAAKRSTWTTSRARQDLGCPPALGLDAEGHAGGASSEDPEEEKTQQT